MNSKIKEKLDEWFCGPETEEVDYEILHYWARDNGNHCYIVCMQHGTLYFMRAWIWNKEVHLSRDGVETVYHHDDYEIVGGAKFVMLSRRTNDSRYD